jgi:stearoyl-CoA desaturase (delta-9 desaturase)
LVTKQWAAVHRKHHAKCDTKEDPHSPQILGLNRVLWGGVFLYVKEAKRPDTIERYGRGTPADWIERNLYSKFTRLGLILMGVIDIILFGLVPGVLILAMRRDLAALWGRSTASRDQLVKQLQDWCRRAEASGIGPLVEFSQRLRSYA